MGVTAFIPAKMTSRRLPRKNLKILCGYPLFYYSVKAAQLAPSINEILVSSEDAELLKSAEVFGATPMARPPELSTDSAKNVDVLKHYYQNSADVPELVVLLQPTHPLRNPKDIENGIALMRKTDADCLFSVVKTDQLLGTIEDGVFLPEFSIPRNKKLEPVRYRNTGSFYIFRPKTTFLTDNPFGKKIAPYVLDNSEFEIDVDTESDFKMVDIALKSNKEKFEHFDCK